MNDSFIFQREKKKLTERETWYIPRSKNEIEEESKDAKENRKIATGRRRLRNIKMRKATVQEKGEKQEGSFCHLVLPHSWPHLGSHLLLAPQQGEYDPASSRKCHHPL